MAAAMASAKAQQHLQKVSQMLKFTKQFTSPAMKMAGWVKREGANPKAPSVSGTIQISKSHLASLLNIFQDNPDETTISLSFGLWYAATTNPKAPQFTGSLQLPKLEAVQSATPVAPLSDADKILGMLF